MAISIHEGIVAPMHLSKDMVPNGSWSINRWDAQDIITDKSRNITILEKLKKKTS